MATQLLASLGRVLQGPQRQPIVDEGSIKHPASRLLHVISADQHWRRGEWADAIRSAERALALRPDDFHALSVIAASHGYQGRMDLAYPFAKRLLEAKPANWFWVKVAYVAIGGWLNFLRPGRRRIFYETLRRCDVEAQADRDSVAWAEELVAAYESAPKGTIH